MFNMAIPEMAGAAPMAAAMPMARGVARAAPGMAVADNAMVGNAGPALTKSAAPAKPKLKEVTKVRTEFPESWIWAEMNAKYE